MRVCRKKDQEIFFINSKREYNVQCVYSPCASVKKSVIAVIVIVCVQDTECLRKEAPSQSLCSGLVAAEMFA